MRLTIAIAAAAALSLLTVSCAATGGKVIERSGDGVVPEENLEPVLARVRLDIQALGLAIVGETRSPIKGGGGNVEFLFLLAQPGSG